MHFLSKSLIACALLSAGVSAANAGVVVVGRVSFMTAIKGILY